MTASIDPQVYGGAAATAGCILIPVLILIQALIRAWVDGDHPVGATGRVHADQSGDGADVGVCHGRHPRFQISCDPQSADGGAGTREVAPASAGLLDQVAHILEEDRRALCCEVEEVRVRMDVAANRTNRGHGSHYQGATRWGIQVDHGEGGQVQK